MEKIAVVAVSLQNMMGGCNDFCQVITTRRCGTESNIKHKLNSIKSVGTNILNLLSIVSPSHLILEGGSAALQNYWRLEDVKTLSDLCLYSSPSIILPDVDTLVPSQQGIINLLLKLSSIAQTTTVVPHLKSASLILLGQFCGNNCTVVINKTSLFAIKDKDADIKNQENILIFDEIEIIKMDFMIFLYQ